MSKRIFALHIHHGAKWLEVLTEPISVRRQSIRQYKPKREEALRLRLLQSVSNERIPKPLLHSLAAYRKERAASRRARAAYERAEAAWRKAYETYEKALKKYATPALHKRLCRSDCPWDGRTILPWRQGGS